MPKIYFIDAKINIFLFPMPIFSYSYKICPWLCHKLLEQH